MAFDITYLQPSGGQGKRGRASQEWTYWTDDAHTVVDGSGYFNASTAYGGAYNLLHVGDIINVVVWSGTIGSESAGAISTYGPHIVLSRSGGEVDVSDVTTGTVTDSD